MDSPGWWGTGFGRSISLLNFSFVFLTTFFLTGTLELEVPGTLELEVSGTWELRNLGTSELVVPLTWELLNFGTHSRVSPIVGLIAHNY